MFKTVLGLVLSFAVIATGVHSVSEPAPVESKMERVIYKEHSPTVKQTKKKKPAAASITKKKSHKKNRLPQRLVSIHQEKLVRVRHEQRHRRTGSGCWYSTRHCSSASLSGEIVERSSIDARPAHQTTAIYRKSASRGVIAMGHSFASQSRNDARRGTSKSEGMRGLRAEGQATHLRGSQSYNQLVSRISLRRMQSDTRLDARRSDEKN